MSRQGLADQQIAWLQVCNMCCQLNAKGLAELEKNAQLAIEPPDGRQDNAFRHRKCCAQLHHCTAYADSCHTGLQKPEGNAHSTGAACPRWHATCPTAHRCDVTPLCLTLLVVVALNLLACPYNWMAMGW